ncbi:YjgN family protein [Pseudoduganella chitinolytica]|uniref:YjgN family protein n=1 Tax=Pseudoduganella chitinolytica TaxID=34070 RepID=A0ABY8BA59_9BURK|nr:YjgN family protein [Pseudoduganella chitinolytica]WEF31239.1 YjgN family protein [Pseudoduganella chitinolytica]
MSAVFESAVPALAREERIEFTATGGEYFRIWIVNLLLTIVTLGVYSAWAKVRRNQYFYASTRLAGSTFEYHGKPLAILRGRVVGVILLGAYQAALRYHPPTAGIVLLLIAGVMPWLVWKSLQFALHNSSYRGVRFGFRGSWKGAYLYYLGLPLLAGLTLGLLYPLVHQRIKRFQHAESRYGTTHFAFDAPVGQFYKVYGILVGLLVLGGGVAFGVVAGLAGGVAALNGGTADIAVRAGQVLIVFAGVLGWYAFTLCVVWAFMAILQNLIWNHTQLGPHRFRSTMTWPRLAGLYITNTLAIVCTLGLFIPFAQVRALKYRLESTTLVVAGSLDDVVAAKGGDVNAVGESVADLAGFDLAL